MDLKQEKAALRKRMLAVRAEIPLEERKQSDHTMFLKTISLPEYKAAHTIFIYVSVADEPDTRALIADAWKRGKRVCVPRCESLGIMHAFEIRSMEDLGPGKYNIPEPKEGCAFVPPDEIDLNIIPCVCSSVDAYRLGYGGGFYDRWLEKSSSPSALLCFGRMILASVPRDTHDQRADILISDHSVSMARFR